MSEKSENNLTVPQENENQVFSFTTAFQNSNSIKTFLSGFPNSIYNMVALLAVQIIIVLANTFTVSKSSLENCHCHLHNATLTLMNNRLQFVEDFSVHHYRRLSAVTSNKKQATASESSKRGPGATPHVLVKGISRCFGTCRDNVNLVCRPSVTSLKTVTVNVPWTGISDLG